MMKKVFPILIVILLFIFGIGLLAYPTLSDWLAKRGQSIAVQNYDQRTIEMNAKNIEEEFKKAEEYNDALSGANIKDPFVPESGYVLPENYLSILNIDDTIGYINIPKIDVNLPIYHGTDDEVLQKGVGHMEMTAFPIGGEGNHAVLTGHTGIPSAKFFTDLTELEMGDVFYIVVLNQTIAYEVDQILVVKPDETDSLKPVAGEDYVTLVTCTPYGINSHRLLVRGMRIPYEEAVKLQEENPQKAEINWRLVMIVSFAVLSLLAFIVYKVIDRRKMRKKR